MRLTFDGRHETRVLAARDAFISLLPPGNPKDGLSQSKRDIAVTWAATTHRLKKGLSGRTRRRWGKALQ